MNTTKLLLLSFVIGTIFLNSCSLHVSREGYTETEVSDSCKVYVYQDLYNTKSLKKVGSIGLSDYGLAINCNWYEVIALLKKEACYAKANVVNITKIYTPSKWSSDCYRFDADFYIDTSYSIISYVNTYMLSYQEKMKIKRRSPFSYLPFNYALIGYSIDYTSLNVKYWTDLLGKYNLPTERAAFAVQMVDVSLISGDYYFSGKFGGDFYDFEKNNSLKSKLTSFKLGLDFGYNLLNKGITLSPFVGFRYLYQNHTVSIDNNKITMDQFMNHPDISIRANQISAVIGLNIVLPIYQTMVMFGNGGYNLNFHKYPFLNSNESSITSNIVLSKNYFFGFGFGYGFPTEELPYDFSTTDE